MGFCSPPPASSVTISSRRARARSVWIIFTYLLTLESYVPARRDSHAADLNPNCLYSILSAQLPTHHLLPEHHQLLALPRGERVNLLLRQLHHLLHERLLLGVQGSALRALRRRGGRRRRRRRRSLDRRLRRRWLRMR